jgi:hypothetical protein
MGQQKIFASAAKPDAVKTSAQKVYQMIQSQVGLKFRAPDDKNFKTYSDAMAKNKSKAEFMMIFNFPTFKFACKTGVPVISIYEVDLTTIKDPDRQKILDNLKKLGMVTDADIKKFQAK